MTEYRCPSEDELEEKIAKAKKKVPLDDMDYPNYEGKP